MDRLSSRRVFLPTTALRRLGRCLACAAAIWTAAAAGCSRPGGPKTDAAAGPGNEAASPQTAEPQPLPSPAAAQGPGASPSAVRLASAEADDEAGRVEGLAQGTSPRRRLDLPSDENPLRPGVKAKPIRSGTQAGGPAAGKTAAKAAPGARKASKPKPPRPPYDPIKEHGGYFEDWPKPKLALVITGRLDGYLEPCGCAGLDRMKGGIGRRYTMLEDLRRKRGWPVVAVDVGGNAKGFGKQAEQKLETVAEAVKKMGYDAVALGKNELRLPANLVGSQVAGVDGNESIFVSANVALFDFALTDFSVQKRIVQRGGMKLGITAVLGKQYRAEINNSDLVIVDPGEALKKIVPELKQAGCDRLILLSHATMDESVAFARQFPEFDVVVTYGGPPEPPKDSAQQIGPKTLLVEVGEKGMAAVVLGFYESLGAPVRYQRVLLDSRYAGAPEMQKLMENYQRALKTLGLAGLGIRPMPNPQAELLGTYVGSAKCESCHEESYRVWKKSKHYQAYKTLVDLKPPRNFDPECLACHVIGWDPAQYTPYEGGYSSDQKTPQLVNVGCESCHGPGEKHCLAEEKNDPELQKKLQKAVVITKEESEKRHCATCHDLDNSPDFDFKTYFPDVEHYEKDQ